MKDKKTIALTLVGVLTLLISIIGATYAYFTASGSTGTQADVSVGTSKEDILTFEVGDDINIEVNQSTFASGKGNASDSAIAKAILITGNETNALTANYNLYLNISKNEFTYTSSDKKAELLLKVTDSTGTELTSISGLEYKTVTDGLGSTVKGFDITTKNGLITILNNQKIVAQPTKTDTWNVEVIFVNLDFDQTANAGKSVSAKLQITKDKYEEPMTLAEYVKSQYITQVENNLYYHDNTLTNGAGDNSYRYAGSNPNNYVCFGSDEKTCPTDNLYRIIGVFGSQVKLIKYDYATTAQLGTDGDYSALCSSVSICNDGTNKGSNSKSLIGAYYWNYNNASTAYNATNNYNIWSYSKLNTVNLNTNYIAYLKNINSKWTNMIADTTWKVGGNTYTNIITLNANTAYINEVINPIEINNTTTENAKIGLMYTSDYYYSASPTYWTYQGYSDYGADYDYRAANNVNWMYMGLREWTIVRRSDHLQIVFIVDTLGFVENTFITNDTDTLSIRPCFYLNSNVTYNGGKGTKEEPILLKLN